VIKSFGGVKLEQVTKGLYLDREAASRNHVGLPGISTAKDSVLDVRESSSQVSSLRVLEVIMLWLTTRKLKSRDLETRRGAIEDLAKSGSRRAVRPLVEVLTTDPSEAIRLAAVEALGGFPYAESITGLGSAVADADASVRAAAARALGKSGDPWACDFLAKALKDGNCDVRNAAAAALGTLIADPHQRATYLVERQMYAEAAREGTAAVQPLLLALTAHKKDALAALMGIGQPSVDDLICGFKDGAWVAKVLGEIGGARAIDLLTMALKSKNDGPWVANALGEIGGARTIDVLTLALKSKQKEMRLAAVEALARIGTEGIAGSLAGAMADSDGDVSRVAAHALAKLEKPPPAPFVDALVNPDYLRRKQALEVLQKLSWQPSNSSERIKYAIARQNYAQASEEGEAAIAPLAEALRWSAAPLEALRNMASPRAIRPIVQSAVGRTSEAWRAVKLLREILITRPDTVGIDELRELGRLGPVEQMKKPGLAWNSPTCFEPLNCSRVRLLARQELMRRGVDEHWPVSADDQTSIEGLRKELLSGTDYEGKAAMALGMAGDPRAVPALLEAMGLAKVRNKGQVIRAIGATGDARGLGPLIALLRQPTIRSPYGDDYASRAVEAVEEILKDSAHEVPTNDLQEISTIEIATGVGEHDDYTEYRYVVSFAFAKNLARKELSRRNLTLAGTGL
jgi:HEAT repeat protein